MIQGSMAHSPHTCSDAELTNELSKLSELLYCLSSCFVDQTGWLNCRQTVELRVACCMCYILACDDEAPVKNINGRWMGWWPLLTTPLHSLFFYKSLCQPCDLAPVSPNVRNTEQQRVTSVAQYAQQPSPGADIATHACTFDCSPHSHSYGQVKLPLPCHCSHLYAVSFTSFATNVHDCPVNAHRNRFPASYGPRPTTCKRVLI